MTREFAPAVYMMASKRNETIYTGVTSNLLRRAAQHREALLDGFTKQYHIKSLVWFEQHDSMEQAILREKRIKKWERAWKLKLIEAANPDWRDPATDFGFGALGATGFPPSRE